MGEADFRLSPAESSALMQIARTTLETGLGKEPSQVWESIRPSSLTGPLAENHPCFVTLFQGTRLRGCMGSTVTSYPLGEGVCRFTLRAAENDPRFSPVPPEETIGLRIGLSVLGPLEPYHPAVPLQLGREGLVAEKGGRRGLLLAKVAVEWGWDEQEFLEQTFCKAGLTYPDPEVQLWKFPEWSTEEPGPTTRD